MQALSLVALVVDGWLAGWLAGWLVRLRLSLVALVVADGPLF